jgi:hypothetical protein
MFFLWEEAMAEKFAFAAMIMVYVACFATILGLYVFLSVSGHSPRLRIFARSF